MKRDICARSKSSGKTWEQRRDSLRINLKAQGFDPASVEKVLSMLFEKCVKKMPEEA